jgi:hypothetical protein
METKKVTKSYLDKPESKHRGNHKAQNSKLKIQNSKFKTMFKIKITKIQNQ